ncbi:MAG: hypothetical protein HFI33_06630 [Lachnospiraceae bacterium]|nr:hypothetical protein [Lachnospiraceae bacterium]
MERAEFQEQLRQLSALAKEKGNQLTQEEVRSFFDSFSLEEEQLALVYAYLEANHIGVEGYIAKRDQGTGKETEAYTREELAFLQTYQRELKAFAPLEEDALEELLGLVEQGDDLAKAQATERLLHLVLEQAKELHGQGLSLEDLVQEGNIGLMLSLEELGLRREGISAAAFVRQEIRRSLEEALAEAVSVRKEGRRIADKVNHISDSIEKLSQELERQVTLEELAVFLDMSAEEIENLLNLAP